MVTTVAAKVDMRTWRGPIERISTSSKTLQRELTDNLHKEGPRIEAEIKGAAFTRIQHRAASTVRVHPTSMGIDILGGGTAGLGGTLFAGGEFGGRKSKKKFYATRSRSGSTYVVKRRTTMQFLPHLGREGYFMWPSVRDWTKRLNKQEIKIVEKSVNG